MTQEEKRNIEASEAWKRMGYANNIQSESFKLGFMMGSDWQRNSVWHDASERPKEEFSLVVHTQGDDTFIIHGINEEGMFYYHEHWYYFKSLKCWAYLDDLLPTE